MKLPIYPSKWFKSLPDSILALYKGSFENTDTCPLNKTLNDLLATNWTLWQYEDNARRQDLPDKDIANLKRNIDKENQKRHDLIDAIDAALRQDIEKTVQSIDESLPINSEAPASILDRLIVLALRTYHLREETRRADADKSHIDRCSRMLSEVENRSEDLLGCMETLLDDYYRGRKRLKSYKQHKLYNDPSLNPSLRKNI